MLRKLLRLIMTALGVGIGYGIYLILNRFAPFMGEEGSQQNITIGIFLVLLFAFILFYLTPTIFRQGERFANVIGEDLRGVSAGDMISSVIGLLLGLVIAFLLSQIFTVISNRYIYMTITVIIYLILGYLGIVVGSNKGKELINQIFSGKRGAEVGGESPFGGQSPAKATSFKVGGKNRKKQPAIVPKILDTSVIIDGRIAEIMKTGFLEGPMVIPEFVLVELRHIADSADDLKRARGRRGLDILEKIQKDYGIEIYNTESEKSLKDIAEVDVKLLKLAQIMGAKVVTNDFNLNKVASINGVDVLNINELANTLKPVVIPGEKMTVTPVKAGKDPNQSIAYLDDGTMVVLEDGKEMIGETVDINVTSVLQTSAGRMIFGRVKG